RASWRKDAARFDRMPRPARRQEWAGQAKVVPRPESRPRAETNAGPELSRVADLNPAPLGGDALAGDLTCFGGIGRRIERSPCALRCDRPTQPRMSLRASGRVALGVAPPALPQTRTCPH